MVSIVKLSPAPNDMFAQSELELFQIDRLAPRAIRKTKLKIKRGQAIGSGILYWKPRAGGTLKVYRV